MVNVYEIKPDKGDWRRIVIHLACYFVIYLIAFFFNKKLNFLSGGLLILLAVECYLFFAIRAKDIIDIVGVFSGIWTFCVGLCMFRLSYVQQPWLIKTWVIFAFVPILFGVSFYFIQYILGEKQGGNWFKKRLQSQIEYNTSDKIYLFEGLVCGGIAIILMVVQYYIKGYFPLFSPDVQARFLFYTKIIVFVVATQVSAPLIIWLLYRKTVKIWLKVLLVVGLFGIVLSTLLRLSRGDYILTVLMVMPCAVHYAPTKKKLLTFFMVLVVAFAGFLWSSWARQETATNLAESFQMKPEEVIWSEISGENPSEISGENPSEISGENLSEKADTHLPKPVTFAYFYLVNGFENFDYAVRNCDNFTYGLRQLSPLTVVLRIPGLREKIAELPSYVNLYSTTSCFITNFYLDFGFWYVFVGVMLFGAAVGIMHFYYRRTVGPVSACVYGVAFAVCALSFFDTWLSFFTIWLFWGTCLLLVLPHIKWIRRQKTI